MNKKIKIIDLYHKIINKEQLPKKIRYDKLGDILTLNGDGNYINEETGNRLIDYLSPLFYDLEKEIEILEDNTEEIEELDTDIHIDSFMDAELSFSKIAQEINKLGKTIRELRKEKE